MGRKHLVIVESPAKAKTINRYLGSAYVVKSSVGHIRDLPRAGSKSKAANAAKRASKEDKDTTRKLAKKRKTLSAQQKLVNTLSIDPSRGWRARYEIMPGKEKVLADLKKVAAGCDVVILATDLDREGEAIAWHLREALGANSYEYRRVKFSEITKKALLHAFEHYGEINMDRVHAQQTRRFLDRVVGFTLSPLLWQKVARGLSAGRVQSVAVRLIVEREKEIKAFHPEEYWQIHVCVKEFGDLRIPVTQYAGKAFHCESQQKAQQHVDALRGQEMMLSDIERKTKLIRPSPPFITSTLQRAASSRLGYGVKRTMNLAQKLYEGGFITYMRTDSTHLSDEAMQDVRSYIQDTYGANYLTDKPQVYQSGSNAQEAHEAIRPTQSQQTPGILQSSLDYDMWKLYDLIWRRTIATQMQPMKYEATTQHFHVLDYGLKISGRVILFDGFYKVFPPVGVLKAKKDGASAEDLAKLEGSRELPQLEEGQKLPIVDVDPSQHYTKPPARFSEAKFVQELEKRGIGRPSTYASIITTIQDRGYVRYEKKKFYALKMGEVVTEKLSKSFCDLMSYNFTANMEEKLDDIAEGKRDWRETLDEFYKGFVQSVDVATADMPLSLPTPTNIPCSCSERSGYMMIKTAATGVFLSCSRYAISSKEVKEKGERCRNTLSLHNVKDYIQAGNTQEEALSAEEEQLLALRMQRRCSLCQSTMDSYIIDETRKIHVCSQNPECSGYELEHGKFQIRGYEGPSLDCDRCQAKMQLKNGRFGAYFACTECNNTRKILKNGEPAPPKADPVPMPELACEKSDGHFVLRDGAAGLFLASSLFPRSRETRKPRVIDLKRHRSELDPKHYFLADAPAEDPEGRDFLIRFRRKDKTYYIASDLSTGKPSSWSAHYDGNDWVMKNSKKVSLKK